MGKIKLLSDDIINQIAAGEIVESPSSALKEIIENSIDANASNIDVFIKNGGKSKIVVEDDGDGLSQDDLEACIMRHATSKLSGNNLFDIHSYGFRGEAIPSIASVSNFSIESNGFGLSISFSEKSGLYISSFQKGAKVCVSDIFDRLPVRIKFLKSEAIELEKCKKIIENFALTRNDVNFSLNTEQGQILSLSEKSLEARVRKIYGDDLVDKAIYFEEFDDKIFIKGYLFHPAHSKRTSSNSQRLFINGRIVKDRVVSVSSNVGYRNIIDAKRYPLTLFFINIDPFFVDINVSPTKSEVKFRDEQGVRKFLVNTVTKHVLNFDKVVLDFVIPEIISKTSLQNPSNYPEYPKIHSLVDTKEVSALIKDSINVLEIQEFNLRSNAETPVIKEKQCFFGKAVAQLFNNYIISVNDETGDVFIIDQHAVHEKITLNKIEKQLDDGNSKYLVRPEVINISKLQAHKLEKHRADFARYGFKLDIMTSGNIVVGANALESNGSVTLIINAIPGVMTDAEAFSFIKDFSEDEEDICAVREYFRKRLGNIACHNSIRSGRKLFITEMDELLKQMESNEDIFQCNHHRPSFLKISKQKLESMFERN